METWETAWVKTEPSMVPVPSGEVGRVGYSSAGICSSEKRELPQVT